ncbi:Uma2 family endonuclease [Leptolyngbyaceae cyanobacterium UHCC 1019]
MNLSTGKHAQAPTIKRFTLEEYHRLGELGFLTASDRIELIRGELVYMAAKGTAHEVCLTKLIREFPRLLADQAPVRCQSPIILTNSEPEPDLTIVKNRSDDYLESHPNSEDLWLLIEISDSSLTYDQETKLSLYAEHNIQDYWIFNLLENVLETYSEPYQKLQGDFGYQVKRVFLPNDAIALPHFPDLILDLSKTFPAKITN